MELNVETLFSYMQHKVNGSFTLTLNITHLSDHRKNGLVNFSGFCFVCFFNVAHCLLTNPVLEINKGKNGEL